MAIKIQSDGTFSIEYEGPYLGLDSQDPGTLVPDKATPSMSNFMLRNAQLCSRPNFLQVFQGPGGSNPGIYGIESFIDINGKFHTVVWSNSGMYQYAPLNSPPWALLGNESIGPNPISYKVFANNVYYTNVAQFYGTTIPFVAYWDGIAAHPITQQTYGDASVSNSIAGISLADSPTVGGSLPGGPTIVGPISIGAQYISELNNQIILANVSIVDQHSNTLYNFPNLIWWSASGLPLQWDPTQNTSAGFNPFLDVSDQITGMAMLGVAGYIFRTNGITQMAPTGNLYTPWQFDHMWASDRGIGNVYPWSIAQYGPTCVFIANDNIYSASIVNATPIGGKARDAIMTDIANAVSGANPGVPVAAIIPKFNNGYVYLTYQLVLNILVGGLFQTRIWVYSFEEQNWSSWTLPYAGNIGQLNKCPPNFV